MRAIVAAVFVLVVFQGAVYAQPGQATPPPPASPGPPQGYPSPALDEGVPPPPAQGYPPSPGQGYPPPVGQGYPPPQYQGYPPPVQGVPPPQGVVLPYAYVPLQLSPEDQELLAQGEISDGKHIGGAITSLFFGFGIGQAVQGRYGDTGWIFTVGEGASFAALIAGFIKTVDRCSRAFDEPCESNDSAGVLLVGGFVGLIVFRTWEIVDAFSGPPKHNRRLRELRMRLGAPQPIYGRLQPYVAPTMSRDGSTAGLTLRF